MSRLGRVNYRESNRSPFLAMTSGEESSRHCSEQTMREIDEEVRRFIDEAIEQVRHILEMRRASLEALTKRLMDVESIDADELKKIIEENSPMPLVVPGTEAPIRLSPAEQIANEAALAKEKSG